jgi:hypothetical protein
MAIWYMVKRLETGEVYGHNTWEYNPVSSESVDIGAVLEQRRIKGHLYHLETYVDAADYDGALLIARSAFDAYECDMSEVDA